MEEKCACGLNLADLARGSPVKDNGFRMVICAKCGREIWTDIKDMTMCFKCQKLRR